MVFYGFECTTSSRIEAQNGIFTANPANKPHFADGFPFEPLDEVCEVNGKTYGWQYEITVGEMKGNAAHAEVLFFYPKACKWKSTVFGIDLVKSKSNWLINDVLYPDDTRLTDEVKRSEY